MAECGNCRGPMIFLGVLGRRENYRCRDCGMEYSYDAGWHGDDRGYDDNHSDAYHQRKPEVQIDE